MWCEWKTIWEHKYLRWRLPARLEIWQLFTIVETQTSYHPMADAMADGLLRLSQAVAQDKTQGWAADDEQIW